MDMENLIGERFGHLTVIKLNNKRHLGNSWLCKCDCGNEIILGTCYLIGSKTRHPNRSCGCKEKKLSRKSKEYSRLYRIWNGMINRCYKPSQVGYDRYGGKGITVCDEWRYSFETFLGWSLAHGYSDELTIDRIESTKPYGPSNCRWSDYFIQEANRGILKNNKTGITGVCRWHEKFRAYITRMGKNKNLGIFPTLAEAKQARENALRMYELTGML